MHVEAPHRATRWCMGVLALLLVGCSGSAAPGAPTAVPATAAAKPSAAAVQQGAASPAAAASAVASPAPAAVSAPAAGGAGSPADFAGKTIHLVVGYAPGGGFDTTARLLAPYLAEALGGNPTMVVENQPGADSLAAARTVLSQPQRGNDIRVVVYISTLLVKSALNGALEGFAPEKESVYLGKPDAGPSTTALCVRKSVVPDLDAFLKRSQPLKVAGLTGGSYYDALLRWTKAAGFPIDPVFGYASTSPMNLAFTQGEVDGVPSCCQGPR